MAKGTGSRPAGSLPGAAPYAELSSIATIVDDLARRIGAMADGRGQPDTDPLAADLFAVERALHEASRRLANIKRP